MSLLDLNALSIELGKKQVHGRYGFHWNNQNFIDCLVKFPVVRWTLTTAYNSLVFKKLITPIEMMEEKEKTEIKSMTIYYADGKLNKIQLVDLAKALVTIEYFL
jgi:hypothetical protein